MQVWDAITDCLWRSPLECKACSFAGSGPACRCWLRWCLVEASCWAIGHGQCSCPREDIFG